MTQSTVWGVCVCCGLSRGPVKNQIFALEMGATLSCEQRWAGFDQEVPSLSDSFPLFSSIVVRKTTEAKFSLLSLDFLEKNGSTVVLTEACETFLGGDGCLSGT
ncbi:UNVERIFIED_CONTAM: hypothetical protein K2H54_021519 [Gekko kuhli]